MTSATRSFFVVGAIDEQTASADSGLREPDSTGDRRLVCLCCSGATCVGWVLVGILDSQVEMVEASLRETQRRYSRIRTRWRVESPWWCETFLGLTLRLRAQSKSA